MTSEGGGAEGQLVELNGKVTDETFPMRPFRCSIFWSKLYLVPGNGLYAKETGLGRGLLPNWETQLMSETFEQMVMRVGF